MLAWLGSLFSLSVQVLTQETNDFFDQAREGIYSCCFSKLYFAGSGDDESVDGGFVAVAAGWLIICGGSQVHGL